MKTCKVEARRGLEIDCQDLLAEDFGFRAHWVRDTDNTTRAAGLQGDSEFSCEYTAFEVCGQWPWEYTSNSCLSRRCSREMLGLEIWIWKWSEYKLKYMSSLTEGMHIEIIGHESIFISTCFWGIHRGWGPEEHLINSKKEQRGMKQTRRKGC